MESVFSMPVETILKVEEKELLIHEAQTFSQTSLSSTSESVDAQLGGSEMDSCHMSSLDGNDHRSAVVSSVSSGHRNFNEASRFDKKWPSNYETSVLDQNMLLPPTPPTTTLSQPFSYNIHEFMDERFLSQFDHKTRNKLKAKQRRLDYRSQERIRQKTVMRMKRQDPRFRAAEREKGRFRMQQKRLDPVFRSQERERQRERMKKKRSNPEFREREREQQKSRINVKRLDPVFKEKERAIDRLRMRIKRQNDSFYSTINTDKSQSNDLIINLENEEQVTENVTNHCDNHIDMQNTQSVFPENINAALLSMRSRSPAVDSFHFKKQHSLNFNFYNSSKEQWPNEDFYSKATSCFKISTEDEKVKTSLIHKETSNSILKDQSDIQEKDVDKHETNFKTDNINSEKL